MRNAAKKRRTEGIGGSYRARRAAAIGAVLLSAAAAAAAGAPELDALLDRLRASLSPSADVRAVGALRVETVVEMAGEEVGRVETLGRRRPAALREVLDLAGVRRTMTLLDGRVWMTDANGTVRDASGEEIVDAIVAHALLFHTYLEGSSSPLDVALRETDGLALELRGAGAGSDPPRVLTVEPTAVGETTVPLPRALRQRQHGVEIVTTFEDWREVHGVLFPFVSRQTSGDPRFDLTLRTVACEILDELPRGAIAAPEAGALDWEITDPDSAASIPVELVGGLVLVTAVVGGETGEFLVDTGAGATVLDADFATVLGLAERGVMEARGAGGSEPASFVDVESLRLPGVVLHGQTVVALPLDRVATALGRRLAGILGWDFLSRFAVEIDWPRENLALAAPGTYRPLPGAVRVPLRIEMNVPRVEGVLDGHHRGSFLVDTGNSRELLLHSPFVRAHGYDQRASRAAREVTGVGGSAPMRRITVDRLGLGDAEFRNVAAFFSDSEEGIVAIHEAIGNVGAALFRKGVLAFDYREESLWIRSPSSASASER